VVIMLGPDPQGEGNGPLDDRDASPQPRQPVSDHLCAGEVGRGRGSVPVQYHQFDISDEDGPTGPDVPRAHNGLVSVVDGVIVVMTGIHTGDVDVTVTLHPAEPAPDEGDWQDIVEISAHSASGELMVRGMMDDLVEELPVLSFDGPGTYLLRVHARGRHTAPDLAPDQVTEWYLVQVWPAPAQDVDALRPTTHSTVSTTGTPARPNGPYSVAGIPSSG
jgi:hypothetical protein